MKLLLLLCMCVVATVTASAQDYLNCSLVSGWEPSGAKRSYGPDNLFDYRDGAAEGYLIFSFARMQGIDCKSNGATLSIDVSDMTDADSAYGMFTANRDPHQPVAKIGMGGQLLPQSLLFAKGKYFVEIVENEGGIDLTAALQSFADKMLPLLEGRDTPPEALQWFPPENLVSARLVPESVLGLKILKRGYVAKYTHGQAFIVMEDSPEAAADVMQKLRARFGAAVTPTMLGDEGISADIQYLDALCIFRKGRFIAGYANLPDPSQAAARAAQLFALLP